MQLVQYNNTSIISISTLLSTTLKRTRLTSAGNDLHEEVGDGAHTAGDSIPRGDPREGYFVEEGLRDGVLP